MTAETVKVYREGGAWMARGQMYWPREVRNGKRTEIEYVPCGVWTRPATEDEIEQFNRPALT